MLRTKIITSLVTIGLSLGVSIPSFARDLIGLSADFRFRPKPSYELTLQEMSKDILGIMEQAEKSRTDYDFLRSCLKSFEVQS